MSFSEAPANLPPLILASASPRRRSLLTEHGYTFTVRPSDAEESAPPHLTPAEVVTENARNKARTVSQDAPDALILAVDTEVFFEDEVLGKPADMESAFQMLSRLNGRTHEVYSGVCLLQAEREATFVEITRVHFHTRTEAELRAYLARIGPLDKAGAYAAQDDQGEMIARVEGSFTNVIGLPMEALARELQRFAAPAAI
jgi:septum formation protein